MFTLSFTRVRLGVFITVGLLSLIVLGLAGSLDYGLGIAVAILTLLCVVPVLVIDHFRRGTIVTWTAVELAWLGVFGIHWLATGGYGASLSSLICEVDNEYDYYGDGTAWGFSESICHRLQAITAFAFFNFFMMLSMFIWIIVRALREHNTGNVNVWRSSLSDSQGNVGQPISDKGVPTYAPPPTASPYGNQSSYGQTPYGNAPYKAEPYQSTDAAPMLYNTADPYNNNAGMA